MPVIWHRSESVNCVLTTVIAWAIGDCCRYPYYQFKNGILGHIRYNAFIVLYPIGVLGEYFCFYQLAELISAQPPNNRLYTWTMPNNLNFGFDFVFFAKYIMALMYVAFWPAMYLHMFKQRARFYNPEPKTK